MGAIECTLGIGFFFFLQYQYVYSYLTIGHVMNRHLMYISCVLDKVTVLSLLSTSIILLK